MSGCSAISERQVVAAAEVQYATLDARGLRQTSSAYPAGAVECRHRYPAQPRSKYRAPLNPPTKSCEIRSANSRGDISPVFLYQVKVQMIMPNSSIA